MSQICLLTCYSWLNFLDHESYACAVKLADTPFRRFLVLEQTVCPGRQKMGSAKGWRENVVVVGIFPRDVEGMLR